MVKHMRPKFYKSIKFILLSLSPFEQVLSQTLKSYSSTGTNVANISLRNQLQKQAKFICEAVYWLMTSFFLFISFHGKVEYCQNMYSKRLKLGFLVTMLLHTRFSQISQSRLELVPLIGLLHYPYIDGKKQ